MRPPSRRWLLWSAVALLLAGLLGAAVLSIAFGISHRDRVTMIDIRRLKLGMDESSVRRILGEERTPISCAEVTSWEVDPSWSAEEWKGQCITFRALFDSDRRLRAWSAARLTPGKSEWTDRVVDWLDWLGL
jgi:hypothetical protein